MLRAKTQLAFVLDVFKMDVPENGQGSHAGRLIFYYHEKKKKKKTFLIEQNILVSSRANLAKQC